MYRTGMVHLFIEDKDSYRYTWTRLRWLEEAEFESHVEEIDETG